MYENRAYYPKRLSSDPAAMAKRSDPQTSGFGVRLAQLRKDAGYTQQQLADEIGATRRQIAYYEGESEHPPASLLIDLAHALNVTTDQLLGLHTERGKAGKPAVSIRLERRLKLIERMPTKPKQQLLSLIDTFISAEQNRQGTKP